VLSKTRDKPMKEYINTEFEELPSDWNLLEIESVIKNEKKTIDPAKNPEELFEYYSIPAYQDEEKPYEEIGKNIRSQKLLITKDTILFGKLNPRVPKIWLVDDGSRHRQIASTEFIPLQPIPEAVNSTFLYYLCWSKYILPKSRELVSGSTPSRQRVDHKAFKKIIIPHPPLDEQRNIAHILSTIQQAIEATDKVITAAQELKKSLMQYLFTYGPVSLEEAEQIPLKETDIGMIPKHWELTTVKEYSNKLQYGFTASATDKKVGPKILRITDIKEGLVDWDRVPYCECSEVDYQKYSLSEGDILVARIGATTGKTYMVNQIPSPTVFASYLIKIVTSQNVIPEYLYHFFNTPAYWKQINESKEDKLKKGVSASLLSSLTFPKAPFNEQTKVKTMLTIVNKKIYTEQKRKNTLQSLFNSMLHHLMTGKLRVKDLDLNIPEEVAQ